MKTNPDLLNAEDMAGIEPLELIATRVVDGLFSGRHQSKLKGGSAEFLAHRAYSPGDEVRLLDWRVFARSDRYYIKQFEDQTNLQALLLLDASGSMRFGLSTWSKFDYARAACAALCRLVLHQSDAAGLALLQANVPSYLPPRADPKYLQALMAELTRAAPEGPTALSSSIQELAGRIKKRGLFLIFSDCFDDLDQLAVSLKLLRSRGHETILFHVLAPEELAFSFSRWSRFECLEGSGRRVELDPASIRSEYIERLRVFLNQLKRSCGQAGCEYVPFPTDKPLGEALSLHLRHRAARHKQR